MNRNMFFNEKLRNMSGVGDLQKNFNGCIGDMRFMRRCLAKCMLSQKYYEGDYEPHMIDSTIHFWDHVYENIDGGHFRTHEDNKHLIELFKVYHTMVELNAMMFYTTYAESAPFPSVKVERSNGQVHEAFLDTINTLRFSNTKLYIRLRFIDNPKELIEQIVNDKFKRGDFQLHNESYPVSMYKTGLKLTDATVEDIRSQCMEKRPEVSNEELADKMINFMITIDEINQRINYHMRAKFVQLSSFIKTNPDFNHVLEIRRIHCSNEEDADACKMVDLLNENMDHQLTCLHQYTVNTPSHTFYRLFRVVNHEN